jgi:tetratricopeptide (TPR) repeat protein
MKFRLLTAVWGSEFCDHFVRLAARSLLATGNFPDLSRRHPTAYSIWTTEQDATRIKDSRAFEALAACGEVELQTLRPDEIDPSNPSSHWIIWRKGIEAAKKNGEFVIYIMPDIVYASGTLLDWAKAFEQGYRAIVTSIPEVVLETTLWELEAKFPAERQLALGLEVRAVNDLCLKHLHPYHLCMLRDSRRWVPHPEMVGYVVPNIAFVQRIMGSHPMCFDPTFFEFNHAYVPMNRFEKIAVLPSTAISLEPFLKFMPLYYRSWKMVGDRLSNLGWWFDYFTSTAHDLESSHSYTFPVSGRWSDAAVARAHASGNFYRAQCLATRAIFRIWNKLVELGCTRGAEILATAHYAGRLRRYKLLSGPTTVLVPSNEALDRAGLDLARGSNEERRRMLLQFVHSHCFTGHYKFRIGEQIVATAGGEIRATSAGVPNSTEGAGTVVSGPVEVGGFTIYATDFVVPSRNLRREPRERSPRDAGHSSGPNTCRSARNLILAHPSLELSHSPDLGSHLGPETVGIETRANDRALAEMLRRRVEGVFTARPGLDRRVDEQKTIVNRIRAHIDSSPIQPREQIRRVARALASLWPFRRTATKKVQACRDHIRELLLAGRFEELDSVAAESAQAWRELGGEFGAQGQVEVALYCRRRASEFHPDDLQLRVEWVRELLLAGRLEDAAAAGRGFTLLWRTLGGGFLSEGQHELGLYCRRRAVEADPADLQVRQELIRDLLLAGRFDEANSADGGLPRPWCILGNGFLLEGQHDLGLYCLRRAVELDPSDMQVRKDLVRELLSAGRTQEANAAISGFWQLWRELAGEFAAQGNAELKRYCLGQADGSPPASFASASERFFRKIQIEIGLVALHDLLKAYSADIGGSRAAWSNGSPAPLEHLEKTLAGMVTRLDPLNDLTQLLEQHPGFAEAWLEKAFMYIEAGQVLPAVDAALRALHARPRCSRAAHHSHPQAEAAALIASCLERAGLLEQAIKAYRRCLSIHGAQPLIRVRLGQLLWRQGCIGEAMEEFMKGMAFGSPMTNLPDLPRRIEQLSLT